jgi:hypothetical protein
MKQLCGCSARLGLTQTRSKEDGDVVLAVGSEWFRVHSTILTALGVLIASTLASINSSHMRRVRAPSGSEAPGPPKASPKAPMCDGCDPGRMSESPRRKRGELSYPGAAHGVAAAHAGTSGTETSSNRLSRGTSAERELHGGAHCRRKNYRMGICYPMDALGNGVGTGYWRFFRRAPTAVRYGLGQIETTHSWLRIASLLLQMEPNEHRNK